VKNVYSKSQDGVTSITVEFRLEKPIQEAVDDVRDAVARVRSDLPADLRDPVIQRVSLAGAPILTYALASERMDAEQLSWFIDDTVTKTMLAVRGVGAVSRVGGVSREVRVELDPGRLLALNATAADISRQLRQVQQEASGGRADVGGVEQSVRTVGTVRSAAEIGAMDIALSDGRSIRLDQVARVYDTVAEPRSVALLNGAPVVGFEVVRSRGAGEVEVADGVKAALDRLIAEHPDLKVTEAFNNVDQVYDNFVGSMWLLMEGSLLAVVVVWFFLRDWRATFVAAVALPLSIIPTFGAMYLLGFSLNVVTLLAMSLVVGILVDDAIVEIENIVRHMRMGKTPMQAAIEAADEIGLAVIATTFTLIAVFLPTAFMPGIAGKFFVQFGWTAAIAVFFSLVVARLLTPMMAAYILAAEEGPRRAQLAPALPEAGALVPEEPPLDAGSHGGVRRDLVRAVVRRLDAGRLHPAGRSGADAGHADPAARQHAGADPRDRRGGARDHHAQPARALRVHGDRRRCHRQRSVHGRGRGRGAQGVADDQADRAWRAQRHQPAADRTGPVDASCRCCPARASTSGWPAAVRAWTLR
jgi:multidrug efflux pump subunit AcrB